MEHTPFSVSMCVYGGDDPLHFRTATDSILDQTVPPDEVVLVVDGPVPEVLDRLICEYEDNPIFRVVRLPENRGHGEARRVGLESCRFSLVALMDADDISTPDRFARQLAAFQENPAATVVGGNIREFIGTPDNCVGARNCPTEDAAIKEYMKTRCPMNQVTVMFRREEVERVGGYIDWYCEEDYYLWLRLYLGGAVFCNVDAVLVHVRVGEEMYRRRGGWRYFRSEARLQTYMRKNKIISYPLWCKNVLKRLIVQVLLPNRLRGWVFQRFAREKADG